MLQKPKQKCNRNRNAKRRRNSEDLRSQIRKILKIHKIQKIQKIHKIQKVRMVQCQIITLHDMVVVAVVASILVLILIPVILSVVQQVRKSLLVAPKPEKVVSNIPVASAHCHVPRKHKVPSIHPYTPTLVSKGAFSTTLLLLCSMRATLYTRRRTWLGAIKEKISNSAECCSSFSLLIE